MSLESRVSRTVTLVQPHTSTDREANKQTCIVCIMPTIFLEVTLMVAGQDSPAKNNATYCGVEQLAMFNVARIGDYILTVIPGVLSNLKKIDSALKHSKLKKKHLRIQNLQIWNFLVQKWTITSPLLQWRRRQDIFN